MAPPNGSDSERLMAQIEAYLRTGEAPPPAPEPPLPRRDRSPRRGRPSIVARARAARRRPPRPPDPSGAPRWTVGRAVLLAAFVVGLVLVPVVWRASSKAPGPAGADRASPAPAGPGYSFLRVNRSGTPVRWDPCTPITYQLDLAGAPAWAQDDILGAITAVSDATGIQFAPDGTTNQFPASDVPPGTASATPPVVIAWASGPQSAQLGLAAGDPSGVDADHLGRTVPVASYDQTSGRMVYITGSVVLGAAAGRLPGGFGPGGDGLLVLHQLGRLLGLGDVPDPSEVMDPAVLTTGVTALGAGDRAGLHRLGRASGCVSPPAGGVLQPVL